MTSHKTSTSGTPGSPGHRRTAREQELLRRPQNQKRKGYNTPQSTTHRRIVVASAVTLPTKHLVRACVQRKSLPRDVLSTVTYCKRKNGCYSLDETGKEVNLQYAYKYAHFRNMSSDSRAKQAKQRYYIMYLETLYESKEPELEILLAWGLLKHQHAHKNISV